MARSRRNHPTLALCAIYCRDVSPDTDVLDIIRECSRCAQSLIEGRSPSAVAWERRLTLLRTILLSALVWGAIVAGLWWALSQPYYPDEDSPCPPNPNLC